MSRADNLAGNDKGVQDFVLNGEITEAEISSGSAEGRKWFSLRRLRLGFKVSLVPNGYIALPIWLGGLVIQWGVFNNGSTNTGSYSFPMEFPVSAFSVSLTRSGATGDLPEVVSLSKTQVGWRLSDVVNGVTANNLVYVIAVGY